MFQFQSWSMYKSYATIALRSLAKQKAFTIINIICLSVGMSVGLLALAASVDIWEVDNFIKNRDSIYRVITDIDDGSRKVTSAASFEAVADKIATEMPAASHVVKMRTGFNENVRRGDNDAVPLEGYYVDANFLDVFSFPVVEGNIHTALTQPFSIVLTESAVKKIFGNQPAVGKQVVIDDKGTFVITAVLKDYPRSHLLFEGLCSYSTLKSLNPTAQPDWTPVTNDYTYLVINDEDAVDDIAQFANEIVTAHFKNDKLIMGAGLQPITEIPMSDNNNEPGLQWGKMSIIVFFLLSLLVLLPACFNYTNISIARALKRAKEIGLRKVSGGHSSHIFLQMVIETIILAGIALIGSILIFIVVREHFLNMIVRGSRSFDLEITPLTLAVFIAFGIITGFLAGFLPALYFGKLNPIETLRNSAQSGKISKVSLRKWLIVAQFSISLVFILGVAIVFKQYKYALNFDLGFQKENILDVQLKDANPLQFKTAVQQLQGVRDVSMSSGIPGNWLVSGITVKEGTDADSTTVYQIFVDDKYIPNLALTMLAGNNFSEDPKANERSIIVNEEFLNDFKIASPHDAVGKSFLLDSGVYYNVAGVVRNFNFMPLQQQIEPFFFRYDPTQFRYANVKLHTNEIQQTLAGMETTWNTLSAQTFEARFLDEELEEAMVSFRTMIKIFGFLGFLAITISALGLLAVVVSTAESRMREMGIRKVFGATSSDLSLSLSRTFMKLILIAIAIGTPVSYLFFDQVFLQMYYYRANIGFMEIFSGIMFLLLLVGLIIGSQTFKVSRVNPVDTLKYE